MAWGLVLILLLTPCGMAKDKKLGKESEKVKKTKIADNKSTEAFFNEQVVRKFKIDIGPAALDALNRNNRNFVRANVTVDGQEYKDVGVHLKGHGSFRGLNDKPSFTIKFDQFTPDQTYAGFGSLWLNNSVQDGTYMNEIICRSMFRDAGLPTPRVAYARLELNGKYQGIYLIVEPVNKHFLRQYFNDSSGNLYKPYLLDIDQPLPIESGIDTTRADLKELLESCREKDLNARWKRLNQILDVEMFLDFTVVEMITAHWDGYIMNRNNYFLYREPRSGLFKIFTHDLDGGLGNTGQGLMPPEGFIITQGVMQIPEARWRYRERLTRVCTNALNVAVLTNRINKALACLMADARNAQETNDFRNFAQGIKNRVIDRSKNIAQQLANEPQQLFIETAGGSAHPLYWAARKESGNALLDKPVENGQEGLLLSLTNSGACSWVARVFLPPGKYSFQGKVRLSQYAPLQDNSNAGACLRVQGERTKKLTVDGDFALLEQEWEVKDGNAVNELACELRAAKGTALVACDTLKVVRK